MKPHEETWRVNEDSAGELDVYRDLDGDGTCMRVLASDSNTDADKARARLAAQAPAMARLLLRTYNENRSRCEPGCELVTVLRAAGVVPSEADPESRLRR